MPDTPSDKPAPDAPIPGPWSQTKTTRIVMKPVEFEMTTKTESSHVPSPCRCKEHEPSSPLDSDQLIAAIQQVAVLIMQKLDDIRAHQQCEPEPD